MRTLVILFLFFAGSSLAHSQARATASRIAEGQIGFNYINANSDYARSRFNGYGIYGDLDFHRGFGIEAEYRSISDGDPFPQTNVYQRTYQIGARYSRHYGRYQPYAKLLIGRGVQNYPYNTANLAYNIGSIGVGSDIRVTHHFNARIDYEYQHWFSFSKDGTPGTQNDSLTPTHLSAGIAYHF